MNALFETNLAAPAHSVTAARARLADAEAEAIASAGVDSDLLEIYQTLAADGIARAARGAIFKLGLRHHEENEALDHVHAIRAAWLALNISEEIALRRMKP
jgi:hypothetical protein